MDADDILELYGEEYLLEQTENGPRPEDGEQPSQDPDAFPLEVQ